MRAYADNAATMRMRESAYNAMLPYLRENYGNPSSIHEDGIKSHEAVEHARKTIAECIGAKPNEIQKGNNMATKKQLAQKQEYLSTVKWLDSEEYGKDTCGTYVYCAKCNKAKDFPCARAFYALNAEK